MTYMIFVDFSITNVIVSEFLAHLLVVASQRGGG